MTQPRFPLVTTFLAAACMLAVGGCAVGPEGPGASDADSTAASQGPAADAPAAQESRFDHYLALGDSYASMASMNQGFHGIRFCLRSPDNYPAAVARELAVTDFTDASCQGAKIPDLTAPRSSDPGNPRAEQAPPQLDSVTADTDLITVSLGGNDIGYGPITICVQDAVVDQRMSNCAQRLESLLAPDMEALPGKLDLAYGQITQRAPQATVVATGYMPLVAATDSCEAVEFVSDEDRRWAAGLIDELNTIIEEAADRNGILFALPDGGDEHTGCAEPDQRWVDMNGVDTAAAPMHPTATGQNRMAEEIIAALD